MSRRDPILAALDRAAASFTKSHDAVQTVAGDILGEGEMFTSPMHWPAKQARTAVLAIAKVAPPRVRAQYTKNARRALKWVDEFETFVENEKARDRAAVR
jgi:hypothetical protein